MEVDLGELGNDQVKPPLLVESGDLVLELEPLEDIDVGREPRDVVDQVGSKLIGLSEQLCEVVRAGVVEAEARLLADLDVERTAVVLLRQRPDLIAGGFKDAVETTQDRERQDHPAVLVGLVDATKLVSDRPHEIA